MSSVKPKQLTAPLERQADRTFREMIRTYGLLERVMQPYFAQFGISGAQWGVLRNLHRAEEEGLPGLRLIDLGNRLVIRPPSVTGVVDRLQRAGYVAREGSPTDLRAKRVALTPAGRELVERVLMVHPRQIDAVMGCLDGEEQSELHRLLQQLRQHWEGLLANGSAQHSA